MRKRVAHTYMKVRSMSSDYDGIHECVVDVVRM